MGQSELKRLHAQMDAILKEIGYSQGHGRRADERAGEGSPLQVLRRRQGPRRDPGVHRQSARLDSGADAARVQHAGQPEHGSETAAARRRARRAGRVRRSGLGRRHDPRPLLDQPPNHRPPQQVQPCRPDLPRGDSRPHLAGRIHARRCRRSASCSPSTPTRKAGGSMPSSSPTNWARTRAIRSGGSAICSRSPSGRAGWWWTPASTPSAGRASRASRFFVDVNGSNPEEVASEVDRYCSWPGQACGYKVGHSEINRQRQKATTALGTRFDVKTFNDTVVLGGNVPLDVLARNVDEFVRSAGS